MDEASAFLEQAYADLKAGEVLREYSTPFRSHAIACFQQAMEKAVKSLMKTLRSKSELIGTMGFIHPVESCISDLVRIPLKIKGIENTRHQLQKLFDQRTRNEIRELDSLIPQKPQPNSLQRRNTEYPYQITNAEWTFPAMRESFSDGELERFGNLSRRIVW